MDRSYQPIPGYFVAEAWSEGSGGDSYEMCLRITAVRNLARVEVVAEIRASHGGYPVNVGEEWVGLGGPIPMCGVGGTRRGAGCL